VHVDKILEYAEEQEGLYIDGVGGMRLLRFTDFKAGSGPLNPLFMK
jgi:hypothetical protein